MIVLAALVMTGCGSKQGGPLRPDGSIVVKPGDEITLKFEVEGDRLVRPAAVSTSASSPNTLKITLTRIVSAPSNTGAIAPTLDTLTLQGSFPRPVTADCSVTKHDQKVEKADLVEMNGGYGRVIVSGANEILLSNFRMVAK